MSNIQKFTLSMIEMIITEIIHSELESKISFIFQEFKVYLKEVHVTLLRKKSIIKLKIQL